MKNIFWLSLSISALSFTGLKFYEFYKDAKKRAASDEYYLSALQWEQEGNIGKGYNEYYRNRIDKIEKDMIHDGYTMAEIFDIQIQLCRRGNEKK